MKILICCAAGMSSSLLVQKMRDEVKQRDLEDIKIGACSVNQLNQYIQEADVLLLAPQINYIHDEIRHLNLSSLSIINITFEEYGTLNASQLMNRVLSGQTNIALHKNEPFFDQVNRLLSPFALKVGHNKSLEAISKSFTSIMPITMIGSIFVLLQNLPLPNYTDFLETNGLSNIFSLMTGATMDILSLYLVFFVAYHYVKSQHEHGHPAALLALICFFLITGKTGNYYALDYLGTKGIFGAIFIGLITGKLYLFILKYNQLKLPKTIPSQVTRSLNAIFPSFIIISFFTCIVYLMSQTPYGNLHNLLYKTLQSTLNRYLSNNIISNIFFQLITNLLWFFGIHGGNIVSSITNPIYIPLALENFALYSQGQEPVNIISNVFAKCFISGGVGSMFSLSILMTLFSKSEQYKTFGKISLPTTFFYINEPLLFGIPIIMNSIYFIPLMTITPTLGLLTYFVMSIGLVPIPRGIQLPWTTPPIIYGLLQGGWRLAFWEILMIFLAMMMWYPFFKIGDREAYKKEHDECHN